MITVVIADDQEMVRAGLRQIIQRDPELQVIGLAADGHQALAMARDLRPDVCVFDVRMPGLTGLEVTQRLATDDVRPAIVIITTYDREEYLFDALQAGAIGFVLKDAGSEVLTGSIHAAASGDALISPRLTKQLISTYVRHAPQRSDALDDLTARERDVLAAVCDGATNEEIARGLNLAVSTVKGHVAALMRKTDTANRVKLVIWAYRNTSIDP